MQWLYLAVAILSEVLGTTCLKLSDGFTKPWPAAGVVAGYGVAFVLLSLTLRTMPVGVAYAVWSGVGIAAITVIGWLKFGQALDAAAFAGIGLIVAGVLVLNVFSKTVAH